MRTRALRRWIGTLTLLAVVSPGSTAQIEPQDQVTIVRDEYGVPHIKATTAKGAFHGLGYVTAKDRLFQMDFFRRATRGELAEIFFHPNPSNPFYAYRGAVTNDREARIVGWKRYAEELVANPAFDQETLGLLEAYAAGVNKRIVEVRALPLSQWPFMFRELQLTSIRDWTASDCISVWMNVESLGWGDLSFVLDPDRKADPGGAVLPDLGGGFAALMESPAHPLGDPMGRKASHNTVVDGERTASGLPLVLGKPQFRVQAPSVHYEFALKGGNYDFRGVGFAGSPGAFYGWNRYLAWSLTGMNADNSDVYEIGFVNPAKTIYRVFDANGQTHAIHTVQPVTEVIAYRDGTTETVQHRRTHYGPLVDDLLENPIPKYPGDQNIGWAVRSLILDDIQLLKKHSITGSLRLMKAANRLQLIDACREWAAPAAHLLVAIPDGSSGGEIGYRSLTQLPLRPWLPPNSNIPYGTKVFDGNLLADDWLGKIPFQLMPALLGNPPRNFLSTGNNLAVDPALLIQPQVLGSRGDTDRSWRMREAVSERLALPTNLSLPDLVNDDDSIDQDMVHSPKRVFVLLARAIDAGPYAFSANAQTMLADIAAFQDPWHMDASVYPGIFSRLLAIGAAMGQVFFRPSPFDALIDDYGNGGVGVLKLLREMSGDEASFYSSGGNGNGYKPALEAWVDAALSKVYAIKDDVQFQEVTSFRIVHQWNLRPLRLGPSEDPANKSNWPAADRIVTGLKAMDGGTIWSQVGETYKFVADLSNPDNNMALLAPGISEDPLDPTYAMHLTRWTSGTMYPAPITWGLFTENPVATLSYPP